MRKIGSSSLMIGASVAAMAVGILVACAHDKGGQVADAGGAPIPDRPDWNWDVRPILSQNCFACHGQGTQKAGLRLDIEKAAYGDIPEDKGKHAIVPGNVRKSELFKRITSTDADYRMPPKDSHKTLSPRDIAVIEKWIKQGAKYKQHWAYIQPSIVKPEKTSFDRQAVNQIDRYVYARLAREGLQPSAEADRETLINRVTLDLTGLPPTLADVDAFVADKDPNAYEHLVDRLLASKEYAERQTNIWLDVARYADSRGGLNDGERPISFPYRDWVISAFERNLPYDKFATWQLAGDKLPGATREQLLATAFLKAGRQDSEGGSIDEEFRTNYVQERTELIGKDILGLTVGCAKCHDHKYDVIAQADYYSMSGFFNQMDERGVGSGSRGTPQGSTLEWPTALQTKNLVAAHAVTVAKQAAYQNVLRAAQAKAAAAAAAVPDAQRVNFVEAAVKADTQAYYPLDNGYKGDFASLYLDPQAFALGAPIEGQKDKFGGLPRAQVTVMLQKKILADVAAGKPAPMINAGGPPQVAGGKPGLDKAAMMKGGKPGAGPGEGKPALDKAALRKDGQPAGPAGMKPGMMKVGLGGKPGPDGKPGAADGKKKNPSAFGRRAGMAADLAALQADPGLPRIASREVDWALEQLLAAGYTDDRLGDPQRISKRQLQQWVHEETLLWTDSGLPNGGKGFVSNVKFVPGHKGQGIQLRDSVFSTDKSIGQFERTQPYSLDFWIKLPKKPYYDSTRPLGPSASILYNNGGIEGLGYELAMSNGKLSYAITHNAPTDMILVSTREKVPTDRWVHITSTYDGNSKAAGMHLYLDGKEAAVEVEHDHLTRSSLPRGFNSQFGSYFGLASGVNFNRPELVDGALDELRVITRALTPIEVAYLQDPKAVLSVPAAEARAEMAAITAQKDPAVQKAWADLTDARLAEQRVETPISRIMVAGDQAVPRVNYVLDRGVYNTYLQVVPAKALPRVFPWSDKLPRNRLGLAEWLFDPKHPLTSRVYVNRLWQNHFGSGIVQTVDDFGTQGANPTHPELLDYLAVEFVKSGWDIKHMQKLMVMSATYRQNSNIGRDALEKDPRNFLLERGPRFRMPAETIRDNALMASGLLVKKVGGDAVFPYAPDAIWDGVAQGAVVYPTNVPADENHRRSMYTYIKRNAPVANLVPFDMPDRYNATVSRPISNTPLQGLVMLNDVQFMEAYRKLAERAIKSSANEDQQLIALWRLAVRRHPDAIELGVIRKYRAAELALMRKSPDEVKKLLTMGVAPADPTVDPAQLAAMTVVTASVMNTPDAYTLR
ncbi:MAG: hypothetical protein JWO72_320 [Caulobacteraceae bacterium]|nr:hypothetical protein [Caulobacteraceae bacterium]